MNETVTFTSPGGFLIATVDWVADNGAGLTIRGTSYATMWGSAMTNAARDARRALDRLRDIASAIPSDVGTGGTPPSPSEPK